MYGRGVGCSVPESRELGSAFEKRWMKADGRRFPAFGTSVLLFTSTSVQDEAWPNGCGGEDVTGDAHSTDKCCLQSNVPLGRQS
jgi:hypothetical protein